MVRVINVGAEAVAGQGEFKLIPAGTKVKVALYEVEETTTGPNSKFPGEDQLMYTAKVTEGEFKGRELRYNYVPLHGKGNDGWKLATFAEAIGLPVDTEGNVELPDVGGFNEYLGTEFVARVGQQASRKINPTTGQPYMNNTVTGTLPLKAWKGETPKAEQPKVSWSNT